MFYTKYRPQKFSEMISSTQIADALSTQVKSQKISHAYLFVGSRGIGKTSTARILAKAANCLKLKKSGDPCSECVNCVAIQRGTFTDLIEIDAASNRGIDDIRELKDKIKLAPSLGSKKVYIIDEVHMLTTEAFNALLKTLEEPPKHSMFILCTTEIHKVPDTIKSRCQVYKFKRASVNDIVEKLEKITKEEEVKVSKEDLKRIAQISLGGFRDAETLLQQVIEGNLDVSSFTAVNSREKFGEFLQNIESGNASDAINLINKALDDGIDLSVWSGELLKFIRDLLLIKSNAHDDLLDITEDNLAEMKELAKNLESSRIILYLEKFIKAQVLVKNSFIPQLPLEMAVVDLCGNNLQSSIESDSPVIKEKPSIKKSSETTKSESVKKTELSGKRNETEKVVQTQTRVTKIKLDKVEESWGQVLEKVLAINNSLLALLKSGKTIDIDGNCIVLEVFYSFHKERLENPKNRKVVEGVLSEIYGQDLSIKCVVSANRPPKSSPKEVGDLTDYNISIPTATQVNTSPGAVLDIFDGGLPLK